MTKSTLLTAALLMSALAALLAGCVSPAPAPSSGSVAAPPTAALAATTVTAQATPRPVQLPTVTPKPTALPTPALDPQVQQILDSLGNQGPAPELTNDVWINSEPLRLADLRGNVVIVEFWTYG